MEAERILQQFITLTQSDDREVELQELDDRSPHLRLSASMLDAYLGLPFLQLKARMMSLAMEIDQVAREFQTHAAKRSELQFEPGAF